MIDSYIGNAEIAVMCDIARASGLDLDTDKQGVVERLIAGGLVEVSHAHASAEGTTFAVTRLGQKLLDERGVGVNES